MTSLTIQERDIPRLDDKVAIITGGSSGIGLATARILKSRGAHVHILDIVPIDESFDCHFTPSPTDSGPTPKEEGNGVAPDADPGPSGTIQFRHCDVADWGSLRQAFADIGHVDICVANAGVSQEADYFADTFGSDGLLEEPRYGVIDVNLRAVLNLVKLSISAFRAQGQRGGSIVLTSSATAYAPEQSLPVYSAVKLATIGLVRALRPTIPTLNDATINAVAPAATVSKLLPPNLAAPIVAAGAPVSDAHHVGLAVAYSATATQPRAVEAYGRDDDDVEKKKPGRWNGRVILTLGDRWTEVEEEVARLRPTWLGGWNDEMTRFQQKLTDMRGVVAE